MLALTCLAQNNGGPVESALARHPWGEEDSTFALVYSIQMRRFQWIIGGWLGLPKLWVKRHVGGIVTALSFSMMLNLGLITHRIWPELLAESWKVAVWPLVAFLGTWMIGWALWGRKAGHQGPSERAVGLFVSAQGEYLKGNWTEAEVFLRKLLRHHRNDIEARLLLAGICRRSGRKEEARRQLRRLARLEEADTWRLEIEREMQWIDSSQQKTETDKPDEQEIAQERVRKEAA